jgi:hypothetical protein
MTIVNKLLVVSIVLAFSSSLILGKLPPWLFFAVLLFSNFLSFKPYKHFFCTSTVLYTRIFLWGKGGERGRERERKGGKALKFVKFPKCSKKEMCKNSYKKYFHKFY